MSERGDMLRRALNKSSDLFTPFPGSSQSCGAGGMDMWSFHGEVDSTSATFDILQSWGNHSAVALMGEVKPEAHLLIRSVHCCPVRSADHRARHLEAVQPVLVVDNVPQVLVVGEARRSRG